MATQKLPRFRLEKAAPHEGRKRVKKKKRVRPETTPDGWAGAMANKFHANC